MAFKLNPVTNKWDIVPAQTGSSTSSDSTLKGLPGVVDKKTTASPKGMLGVSQKVKSTPQPTPTTTSNVPTPMGDKVLGPPAPPMTGQQVIDMMWQDIYDEADAYKQAKENFGQEPPASWWEAKTTQVKNAQNRLDEATKAASKDAATKSGASTKEAERIRKIKGGQAGEKFLREQATTRKTEMLKRVAETFDPLQQANQAQLTAVLQNASDAFDLAEKQVGTAQADFVKNFQTSKAYEGVPIATYNVADNPLLAALQQQGAGTEQVTAATNLANQTAKQTSDLEKWAMNQLNIGQQNYGSAIQNAAQLGTTAALQGLGGRRAEVQTGINTQFADQLAAIAKERAGASSSVDETIAGIISKADELAAGTQAEYGSLPKKKTTTKKSSDTKPPVSGISKIKKREEIAKAVVTK